MRVRSWAVLAALGAAGCSPSDGAESVVGAAPPVVTEVPEVPPEVIAEAPPAPIEPWDTSRPLVMRVTGDDYRWRLRYPGADGKLDTADDVESWRHVHLPADTEIVIDLASTDFVYTFYVPVLDILEVAVPDVPFEFDFDAGPPDTCDLLGSQMCGYTHRELLGDVVIETPAEFARWMAELAD